jgi:hypothetical protein
MLQHRDDAAGTAHTPHIAFAIVTVTDSPIHNRCKSL